MRGDLAAASVSISKRRARNEGIPAPSYDLLSAGRRTDGPLHHLSETGSILYLPKRQDKILVKNASIGNNIFTQCWLAGFDHCGGWVLRPCLG